MNELLGIQIPEDLSALSPEELSTLISDLKGAIRTALSGEVTVAVAEEAEKADEVITAAEAEVTTKAAAASELADRRAKLLDKFSDENEGDEPTSEATRDGGQEVGAPPADAEDEDNADEDEGDEDEDGEAAVTASWSPTLDAIEQGAPKQRKPPAAPKFRTMDDVPFKAVTSIDSVQAGQEFEDKAQLAEALMSRFETIKGGSIEKIGVARLSANFTEAQILTESFDENIKKFGGTDWTSPAFQQGVTAAFCAPTEPLYQFATSSSTRRPVKASLANYRPARGSVSVPNSPTLSDVESQNAGYGQWTSDDDADEEATKSCATIPCSTSEVYELYGLWRCLKVKNMMALTFPELVDAILNRLGALHARFGDTTLLDAMLASNNTYAMTVNANAYGGSINLLTTVLNAVELARYEERFDEQRFDAWIPRWIGTALQIDLANQRREGGSMRARLAPISDVNAALREAGLNVTWTLDVASTWDAPPPAVDGAALPELPTNYDIIMTPAGNFRALDRGDLTIGVTNGGIYRDNASNMANEFSIFQESFEGLIDFGARTYHLNIADACIGGAQTADVESICAPVEAG